MKKKTLSAFFVLLALVTSQALAAQEAVTIDAGRKVKLGYTLKSEGKVVDSSQGKEPLSFVYGEMPLIAGLTKGLKGLKAGDKKSLDIAPAEAYGNFDPKAVVEVPKENFGKQELKPGMFFTASSPAGAPMHGMIKELKGDKVVLDFNHPLAGKTLHFDIEVLSVE